MAYQFTREQILIEADRYLQKAVVLPDSDPAKPQYIQAASNLSNVVMARVYHEMTIKFGVVQPEPTPPA
jgi:hypothetical protein